MAGMLSMCGCGGGSTPAPTPSPQAPTGLAYSTPTAVYVVGTPITANNPTSSGGTVSAYSVNPSLPAGLALSSSTGVISGTPTQVSSAKNYLVSASNAAGSVNASISIAVNTAAPAGLAYSTNPAVYNVGVPITANTPTGAGVAATSYTVIPTLPWGLTLNSTTGVISGTPAVASAQTNYTVTAYNSGGNTSATLTITVVNGAPSNLAYSSNPAVYTVNEPIEGNIPSNTGGEATSYAMSTQTPSLPAGLTLNPTTGVISGTPTAVAASSTYIIVASNVFGQATPVNLSITVDSQAATTLTYAPSTVVYTVGQAITPLALSNAIAGSYTVSPALPAGLSLDSGAGTLSGTPAAVTTTETYTVTASTASGNAVANVSITVDAVAPWSQLIPNMDQTITPLAPPGSQFQQLNPDLADNPAWLASQAATTTVSPDGNTLLVLTTGYNRVFNDAYESLTSFYPQDSNEYVFVYDISSGAPIKKQVLQVPLTYFGIAWDPTGAHFYVSGCRQDVVNVFSYNSSTQLWAKDQTIPSIALGHGKTGVGLGVYPCAAGIALSQSGQTMVVANYYNDSLSILTGGYPNWALEDVSGTNSGVYNMDLRPGKSLVSTAVQSGVPGGEYPFWVVIAGNDTGSQPNAVAYVSSIRDREIDVVPLSVATGQPLQVATRIPVKGQPNKMVLNQTLNVVYVAEDQSDTVDVIDVNPDPTHYLTVNTVIETIPVLAPVGLLPSSFYDSDSNSVISNPIYTGANTNSLALSPGGSQLYVTNGNLNAVAVVQLTGTNSGDQVVGLIPTGWYPNSVSANGAGTWMYVANAKSPTGPNPDWCYSYGPTSFLPNCFPNNQYNPQRTKAGLQSFPIPTATQLQTLTSQVAQNNRFSSTESSSDAQIMAAVSKGVQHVIYILKENRTYDQVLGDLVDANGLPLGEQDSSLVQWGQAITPNLHNLARSFVTLDHFFATSEVSVDGWAWSTSARCPDIIEHEFPLAYAYRALALEAEGANRNVNVAFPTLAQRLAANPLLPNDPDLMPGQTDVGAPDGPNDEINTGHLWDAALRAGLTVRNYGFFIDTSRYGSAQYAIPVIENPAATNTVVAYPNNVALTPYTDPYFRGFDNNLPDYYRFKEWEREFDTNYATGGLPSLTLLRLMHDHTGSFATAIDLVNTPELMQADNDYAVGLVVQKIANSIYAQNTLIFVVEDDAQDGGDHIDSHRTIAFVAGAYVKQGAVVSTSYNTIDFVRTMEEVLGLNQFLNLNDALAHPMSDIFTTAPQKWSFTASPSAYLYATQLPLPTPPVGMKIPKSTHDASYWARVTKGLDFSDADRVDPLIFNRILWKGMMHNRPYPPSLQKAHSEDDEDDRRENANRRHSRSTLVTRDR